MQLCSHTHFMKGKKKKIYLLLLLLLLLITHSYNVSSPITENYISYVPHHKEGWVSVHKHPLPQSDE
jgi:hypothetical protein